jgi:8-amino-7-oxononanoate synthase
MASIPDLEQRTRARLVDLSAHGLLRRLQVPDGLDFSSNDYLGLAAHPLIKDRMAQVARRDGCGSTASRLLRGDRAIFHAVENRFAIFKESESSLYFSSGYAANIGALTSFLDKEDIVFSDELNHASIIDALRLARARRIIFPHRNLKKLVKLIAAERSSGQKFLVTESLFSMDGDQAPLAEYAKLCRENNIALIVDEAHAVGIYGARGSGLIEEAGVKDDTFLSVNPAGKALGVCGAFVAGPAWAIDFLVQKARTFIFSTAPPPALAAALDAAISIIIDEPERRKLLKERALLMRSLLSYYGIGAIAGESQIIPIVIGDNNRAVTVAEAMQAEGFDVRAIRPPTVAPGSARLRLSINVNLEEDDLRRFAACLNVGKTVLCAALMHRYREQMQLCYWKPIQTGIEEDDDTKRVIELAACRDEEIFFEGARLPGPFSPHLSARLAGQTILIEYLLRLFHSQHQSCNWIIEGAGGALVPINENELMIDLMAQINLPIVIAARSTLGTINHTLLTLAALRARALTIAGVVMIGEINSDNREAIEHYGAATILGEMPRFDQLNEKTLGQWAREHLDSAGVLRKFFQAS